MSRPSAILLACALLALPAVAGAQAQSDAQQGCINEINRRTGNLGKATGKLGAWCYKALSTAKLVGPTWSQCVDADDAGKLAKARAKTQTGRDKKCDDAELPTLAFTAVDPPAVDAANQAAVDQTRSLGEDVLRFPAVVVLKDRDGAGAACQFEVVKRAYKQLDLLGKESNRAKKSALALGAASDAEIQAAVTTAWDSSPKVAKNAEKLVAKALKKCEDISNPGLIFQGRCTGTIPQIATCAGVRARCRACLMLEAVDGLALDCDAMDDATANFSCS